jgi:hypothetical protein
MGYTATDTIQIQWLGEYAYHSIEAARFLELLKAGRDTLQACLSAEQYEDDEQDEYHDAQRTIDKADELIAYFTPVSVDDELEF